MRFWRQQAGHPGTLPLDQLVDLPADGMEIARLWVSPGQGRSHILVSFMKDWSPELFGALLVECVETAASAFAAQTGIPAAEATNRIWQGMQEERGRLSSASAAKEQ